MNGWIIILFLGLTSQVSGTIMADRCGDTLLMSTSGDITLTDGSIYPRAMDCSFRIQVPVDMRVKLHFEMLDIEIVYVDVMLKSCTYDWLEIHDGPSRNNSTVPDYIKKKLSLMHRMEFIYVWYGLMYNSRGFNVFRCLTGVGEAKQCTADKMEARNGFHSTWNFDIYLCQNLHDIFQADENLFVSWWLNHQVCGNVGLSVNDKESYVSTGRFVTLVFHSSAYLDDSNYTGFHIVLEAVPRACTSEEFKCFYSHKCIAYTDICNWGDICHDGTAKPSFCYTSTMKPITVAATNDDDGGVTELGWFGLGGAILFVLAVIALVIHWWKRKYGKYSPPEYAMRTVEGPGTSGLSLLSVTLEDHAHPTFSSQNDVMSSMPPPPPYSLTSCGYDQPTDTDQTSGPPPAYTRY